MKSTNIVAIREVCIQNAKKMQEKLDEKRVIGLHILTTVYCGAHNGHLPDRKKYHKILGNKSVKQITKSEFEEYKGSGLPLFRGCREVSGTSHFYGVDLNDAIKKLV